MPLNEFRVRTSPNGFCVELCRDGEPYVTFIDGLTRQAAEQEARALTELWRRISTPRDTAVRAKKTQQS